MANKGLVARGPALPFELEAAAALGQVWDTKHVRVCGMSCHATRQAGRCSAQCHLIPLEAAPRAMTEGSGFDLWRAGTTAGPPRPPQTQV
eukprot:11911930-Alexandrium_andersonii.AAC.1